MNKDFIEQLFLSKNYADLSTKELEEIKEWVKDEQEYRELKAAITIATQAAEQEEKVPDFVFDRIMQQLPEQQHNKPQKRPSVFYLSISAIAASVLIVASVFLVLNSKNDEVPGVVYQHTAKDPVKDQQVQNAVKIPEHPEDTFKNDQDNAGDDHTRFIKPEVLAMAAEDIEDKKGIPDTESTVFADNLIPSIRNTEMSDDFAGLKNKMLNVFANTGNKDTKVSASLSDNKEFIQISIAMY